MLFIAIMNIALLQFASRDRGKAENIAHAEHLLDTARGADLIVLPELWNIGFYSFDWYYAESETSTGPTLAMIARKARELNAHILSGSIVENDGGNYYNTNFLIAPDGALLGKYRKIHLFSYKSEEKKLLTPGTHPVTIKTSDCTYGLSTCYDLRFPELYRAELAQGTEVFLISAAWGYERLAQWTIFNRARALENQAFVIAAGCAGVSRGHKLAGTSMIVDPNGTIVAQGGESEEIVTADIDLTLVQKARREFPTTADRVL